MIIFNGKTAIQNFKNGVMETLGIPHVGFSATLTSGGGGVAAVFEETLEEVLGGVNGAGHAAFAEPFDDGGALRRGDEAEGEGEEIGVLRCVIGALAVAVNAARGVVELSLKCGAGGALAGGVIGGVGGVAEGVGEAFPANSADPKADVNRRVEFQVGS